MSSPQHLPTSSAAAQHGTKGPPPQGTATPPVPEPQPAVQMLSHRASPAVATQGNSALLLPVPATGPSQQPRNDGATTSTLPAFHPSRVAPTTTMPRNPPPPSRLKSKAAPRIERLRCRESMPTDFVDPTLFRRYCLDAANASDSAAASLSPNPAAPSSSAASSTAPPPKVRKWALPALSPQVANTIEGANRSATAPPPTPPVLPVPKPSPAKPPTVPPVQQLPRNSNNKKSVPCIYKRPIAAVPSQVRALLVHDTDTTAAAPLAVAAAAKLSAAYRATKDWEAADRAKYQEAAKKRERQRERHRKRKLERHPHQVQQSQSQSQSRPSPADPTNLSTVAAAAAAAASGEAGAGATDDPSSRYHWDFTYDWSSLGLGTRTGSAAWNAALRKALLQGDGDDGLASGASVPQLSPTEMLDVLRSQCSLHTVVPPERSPIWTRMFRSSVSRATPPPPPPLASDNDDPKAPDLNADNGRDDGDEEEEKLIQSLTYCYETLVAQDALLPLEHYRANPADDVRRILVGLENDSARLQYRESRVLELARRAGLEDENEKDDCKGAASKWRSGGARLAPFRECPARRAPPSAQPGPVGNREGGKVKSREE